MKCVLVIYLSVIALPAMAHDIYSGLRNRAGYECCGRVHCHPIEGSRVRLMEWGSMRGYWVDEGESWVEERFALPSPDGRYHICGSGSAVVCFFAPVVGM